MNIRPRANLTFAKCLEMKLDEHIETITKVSEVAGKEFSIEQVCKVYSMVMYIYVNTIVCFILCFDFLCSVNACTEQGCTDATFRFNIYTDILY